MLCAIYCRLSKEDEDRQIESESIQNQKSMLVKYAVEREWDVFDLYCDEDYSGVDSHRPDFNRLLQDAQAGRFQIILCKTQSRLTRDMELVEKYIHGKFPLWGIRFVAIADNVDTDVKGNKKARQINGLINEWYLEDLSENIRMVFDHKRRQGQYIGGFPVYGYQKDPADKNKLIIDPEAADVVRTLFRWSLEGHGKQRIATMLNDKGIANPTRYKAERGRSGNHPIQNDLGLWNKTTVWRILRNEMYTGVMIQGRRKKVSYKSNVLIDVPEENWVRVENTHEAIIDRETFDAVQRGLALRSKSDGLGENHVLSGLVKCMGCGSTMSKSTSGQTSYLRCKLYADSGKQKLCTRHAVRLDALIDLVVEQIRYYVNKYYTLGELQLPSRRDTHREALAAEQRHLWAQLETRGRALKALYLDKVSGTIGEGQFAELNQSFLEEKNRLEHRLHQLTAELADEETANHTDDVMAHAQALLKLDTVPRELIVRLVEKIEIGEKHPDTGGQEVKIYWKF